MSVTQILSRVRIVRATSVLLALTVTLPLTTQAQPGHVLSNPKISDTEGNFSGVLHDADFFGIEMAPLGDLDGDGVEDLAVGAHDNDGGLHRGAVWILFLNADGTVKDFQKISADSGGFTGQLDDDDRFARVASIGDLDRDGVTDLAVGAPFDDDGGRDRGAVWILFLNSDGTVKAHRKISDTEGGFTGGLARDDHFGWSVTRLRDLDDDGVPELVVGASGDDEGGPGHGAVWILFLRSDGTVKAHQKISDASGHFGGILDDGDVFGHKVAPVGDLDRDGVWDLAVGAFGDDDGGPERGAVWILFLNSDGTVKAHQKISDTEGGFTGGLADSVHFARVWSLPDIDLDGVQDLAVGASHTTGEFEDTGAVWILFLKNDGTVKDYLKITSPGQGGFTGFLESGDQFGWSGAFLGDLNDDGQPDMAVAAMWDDDGGGGPDANRGAVWVLFLDEPVLTAVPPVTSSSGISLAASPNPFTSQATLQYALPSTAAVRLRIFDSQGRRVATLLDGEKAAGRHSAIWSGRDASGAPVSAGVYYARLEADGISAARKIVVLK